MVKKKVFVFVFVGSAKKGLVRAGRVCFVLWAHRKKSGECGNRCYINTVSSHDDVTVCVLVRLACGGWTDGRTEGYREGRIVKVEAGPYDHKKRLFALCLPVFFTRTPLIYVLPVLYQVYVQ